MCVVTLCLFAGVAVIYVERSVAYASLSSQFDIFNFYYIHVWQCEMMNIRF